MKSLLRRIPFLLMVCIIVVLAAATIAEQVWGREFAMQGIYHSRWFIVLWAVFALSAYVYMWKRRLHRQLPSQLLHCAFGLILVGALTTFVMGEHGYLHLRAGKPQRHYTDKDEVQRHSLPFEVKFLAFKVVVDSTTNSPVDYRSLVQIDGEYCTIGMNKIHRHKWYRFYQSSYDSDEMGVVLLLSRDPYGICITYSGYVLLAIVMLWLLFLRIGWKRTAAVLVACVVVFVFINQIKPMTPILRTPMLALHVSVIMVSYGLLLYMALSSAVALVWKRRSTAVYSINCALLYPAVFLLAAGIFVGAVWANLSWGRYWGWDAKETWALITLLVYALPFHRHSIAAFGRERFFHRYCLIALLVVVMTFAGVSFLLSGGLHSYV